MSMNKTNVAIIGYGGMGGWHADQLKTMPEIDLLGVYDILEERGSLAEEKGFHAYQSFDEVLSDPRVQLLTVAIPNDQHKEICCKAMEAGKNVICEKPVALSSLELQAMIDTAKKNNVLFTVHQNRRWDEDFLTMKKLYDEGTLGPVFNIETRVHGSRGIPGDWRNAKVHGGGMVLDWGVHMLDQIMMMIKKPLKSVYAILTHVTNDDVDDGFKIFLDFEGGLNVQVEVGTSNFYNLPRWYMQGQNGTAVMPDWFAENGKIVMVSDWEKRDAVPVVTAAGLTKTMAPRNDDTIKEYPLPILHADVKDYYRNVCKALRGEESQIVTHEQVMRVMKVMEAAFKSADTNQVVTDIF